MLFKVSDDWKQLLPPEDEARLNEILKRTGKYRTAYRNAHDIKTAQLWTALLETRKENQALLNRLKKMEFVFDGVRERIKKQDEAEKELIESLEKF
jgi:predicted nuclease with TOPRIM domain